jgi:hypothetical protein
LLDAARHLNQLQTIPTMYTHKHKCTTVSRWIIIVLVTEVSIGNLIHVYS